MRTAGFGNRCSGAQLARGFGVIELMVAVAISLQVFPLADQPCQQHFCSP